MSDLKEKSDYAKAVEARERFQRVAAEMNAYIDDLDTYTSAMSSAGLPVFRKERATFNNDLRWLLEMGDKYTKQQVSDEYVRSIP